MPRNFPRPPARARKTRADRRESREQCDASPFSRTGSADVPDESNACDVPSMPGTRRNQRLEYLAKRSCCRNRERGCFLFPSPSVIARSFRNLHRSSLFLLRGYVCTILASTWTSTSELRFFEIVDERIYPRDNFDMLHFWKICWNKLCDRWL